MPLKQLFNRFEGTKPKCFFSTIENISLSAGQNNKN